ncbi:hypothetical protein [Variovorax sp. OV329]|uniref:hypothetical protein n=1 Tax=Variovorax sp. OV329 TaxID=1882825 RepID=UPI001587F5C9|nr:hypothetical protein [Variovorax sp. OV329]
MSRFLLLKQRWTSQFTEGSELVLASNRFVPDDARQCTEPVDASVAGAHCRLAG